ncbi:LysR family transcriptional regulator [Pseudanabaenaceae cyanobacterium LEGE 13415]|nr:LysR family transcriptional regulator [Pseudanabaenaceae cyanobacterium LEGE 13415]
MELRHLRYFTIVAEELHFGRAADRLQMTQPALSKQIHSLESELGVLLFTRTKRTVQLTAAGQVFLEQAQQLLDHADRAVHLARRAARGEMGTLRLGFTTTATQTVLPAYLSKFRDRYPHVELTMQELSTEAQVQALHQHQIDLAFLHPPIDERGLTLYQIWTEPFVVVLPKHHRLVQQNAIDLRELAQEQFILHTRQEGPTLYRQFLELCQQLGFEPAIVQEAASHTTRICLAAAGQGVTFIPESIQTLVSAEVVCKPIEPCPIQMEFAAAWRRNDQTPVLEAFLAIVRKSSKNPSNQNAMSKINP